MQYPTKIIYVGDPLCSWCYGYSEELEKLIAHFSDLEFQVVVGGLRPHTQLPMEPKMKDFLRKHWKEVNERSGLPFSYDILAPETSFVYDTEKPCRAVVAMRHLNPKGELTFFKRIQQTFYRDNQDTNKLDTYLKLLPEFDVKESDFEEKFNDEKIKKETAQDFAWSREVGASSYPTTILQHNERLWAISIGYNTAENLIPHTMNILQTGGTH